MSNVIMFGVASGENYLLDGFADPVLMTLDDLASMSKPNNPQYAAALAAGASYEQIERMRSFYAGCHYIRQQNQIFMQLREMGLRDETWH